MSRAALAFLLLFAVPSYPALAQSSTVQGQVRKDMRSGAVRSSREIEQRVLPSMRGWEYLGPDYDAAALVYRLKFIRDGRVVFVDVDARSGTIISQPR